MWYIYSMEYYLAIKNKDIMNFEDRCVEVGNIILSEVTQSQKDILEMISDPHLDHEGRAIKYS